MNNESCRKKTCSCASALGLVGAFLLVAWLVWLMRGYTQPPSLAGVRAAERMKIKAEFDAANAPFLDKDTYAWQDQSHGIIRIPLEQAKALVLQEWQNPANGRSVLTNRAAKAFAPAVVAKNPYE